MSNNHSSFEGFLFGELIADTFFELIKFRTVRIILLILVLLYPAYFFAFVPTCIWVENTFKIRVFEGDDTKIMRKYKEHGQTPWWDNSENETNAEEVVIENTAFSFIASDGKLIECDM